MNYDLIFNTIYACILMSQHKRNEKFILKVIDHDIYFTPTKYMKIYNM